MKRTKLKIALMATLITLLQSCGEAPAPPEPEGPGLPYPLAILKKYMTDEEATQLYSLAESHEPDAQYRTAMILASDEVNEVNASFAYLYITDAAKQNHPGAQYELGILHYELKEFRNAFDWIQKSAEQGFTQAEYSLGHMFYHGEGTTQDYRTAVEWYLKAAEKGHEHAQGKLGFAHYFGNGVKVDKRFAFVWLTLAASADPEYAELRDLLAREELSQADVLWGQREAREWTQRQQGQQTTLADR